MIATCGGKVVFDNECAGCSCKVSDFELICDKCLEQMTAGNEAMAKAFMGIVESNKFSNKIKRFAKNPLTLASLSTTVISLDTFAKQPEAVAVISQPDTIINPNVDITHAFDPIIGLLQQLAFPVAITVIGWGCLEAMIGKPASAVNRIKWAVLGYLAMRYLPGIFRGL